MNAALPAIDMTLIDLPWSNHQGSRWVRQDALFRQLFSGLLGTALLLALIISLIDVPPPLVLRKQPEPAVVVKLDLPPPPQTGPAPARTVPPLPPKPPERERTKPQAIEQPPVVPQPAPPGPSPERVREQARKQARQAGVIALQDDLAAMRELAAGGSVGANSLSEEGAQAEFVERKLLGQRAGRSVGLQTAKLSRTVGGRLGDAALPGEVASDVQDNWVAPVADSTSDSAGLTALQARSDEEIRKVMDRNKGAIFAIYNRALRRQPLLRGKLTVKMVIAGSGAIESAAVVASDLNDKELESRLLRRIRMIEFGDVQMARTTLNYSFDFLPG